MRKRKINKMTYAEEYYNRNSIKIDSIFGSKKDFLDTVKISLRKDYYFSKRNARLDMQDLITAVKGGDVDLAYAKRNATNKDYYFPDSRALNRRIKSFSAKASDASWTDEFGFIVEVKQYYEIANSDLVLANIIVKEPDDDSPIESWEYIDRDLV